MLLCGYLWWPAHGYREQMCARRPLHVATLPLAPFWYRQAVACFLCLPCIEAASLKCLSAAMSAIARPVEGPSQLSLEVAVLPCL